LRDEATKTGSTRAGALLGALAVLFVFAGFLAGSARAADSVYWAGGEFGGIFRAPLSGSGAAEVPVGPPGSVFPGGVAIDAAAARIYWTDLATDTIMFANLDGSGVRQLITTGAEVSFPVGLSLDARGGRIYWANFDPGGAGGPESIAYANLDGSGGGTLDTTGATVSGAEGLAVYPAAGRIYWGNTTDESISYANLAGGGGGDLEVSGASVGEPVGVAIDAAAPAHLLVEHLR
jgi:Low-density lipoprotein receptor repeat class B